MATRLEAAGVSYPAEFDDNPIVPTSGESFPAAALKADGSTGIWMRTRPVFWEHEGNCAMREGAWKLVRRHPEDWELYNMGDDRTELHDLARGESRRLHRMIAEYDRRAAASHVLPWPVR